MASLARPCIRCGDENHIAEGYAYCGACLKQTRGYIAERLSPPLTVSVELTYFEASLVLCVLAVAKGGESRYDNGDVPLRKGALEQAYRKLSEQLGVSDAD